MLVDGAQAVMHLPVDVQTLDCDFYAFSGHKLYGPTGIGALYVKAEILEEMPPWEGGGSMIATVSLTEGTTWTQSAVAF
ncbi:aminotransferase class V-fold PLP-dependent enzyme [Escherichia coli]